MPEQKLSIPTPGKIIGNSQEEGGVNFPERLKGMGGGGVWIFSGITHDDVMSSERAEYAGASLGEARHLRCPLCLKEREARGRRNENLLLCAHICIIRESSGIRIRLATP